MGKILLSVALFIAVSACASHGVMISDDQVRQFKRGETTEAEVLSALGRPTSTTMTNGQRYLIYSGAYVQARPASFIPIFGPLVGGADVKSSVVMFRIVDGTVVDITSSQTASGSGTGFAAGAPIEPISDQPRK